MSLRTPARRAVLGAALLAVACVLLVRFAAAPGQAAAPWLAPVYLSAPGAHAELARVAIDPQGTAVAVWTRLVDEERVVQASVRPAGGSWQAPTDLERASGTAADPQVAVDARGDAFAVWERFRDRAYVVQAAIRPAGGSWRPATTLSSPSRRMTFPRIAVDPRGNAVAVWDRYARRVSVVQAAARRVGGAWRRPVAISRIPSATSNDYAGVQVAIDAHGDAVAVWTRTGDRPAPRVPRVTHIQAALRRDGSWSVPVTLSAPGRHAAGAHVAVNARGDAVAAWSQSTAPLEPVGVVQSASRLASGRWQAPVTLSLAGEFATQARVGLDARGTATAIWNRSDLEGASSLRGATRAAGGRWQRPVDISPRGEHAYGGELAVSERGAAFVVWHRNVRYHEDTEETDGVVRAAQRAPGRGWQAPVDVSAVGNLQGPVQVAIDPRGRAVAVWEILDGRDIRVQAAAFPGG